MPKKGPFEKIGVIFGIFLGIRVALRSTTEVFDFFLLQYTFDPLQYPGYKDLGMANQGKTYSAYF